MAKILVTGHLGFIGSHFCEEFQNKQDIVGVDIESMGDIRQIHNEGDYSHIFHFAALRSVPLGESNPREFIDTNVWGTLNLIRSFPKSRFINISSSSVNEIKGVYGFTKFCAEKAVESFSNNYVNLRLYNVFGERQKIDSGAAVPLFIKAMFDDTLPSVYGSGNQKRDFTYVKDAVREVIRIGMGEETGTFNIGYSDAITVNHLLRMIYGYNPKRSEFPKRSYDILTNESPTRMKNIKYGREEGIRRTIEWFKQYYSL